MNVYILGRLTLLLGGGGRVGELAVPCNPKPATRGDPLTEGGGEANQG